MKKSLGCKSAIWAYQVPFFASLRLRVNPYFDL